MNHAILLPSGLVLFSVLAQLRAQLRPQDPVPDPIESVITEARVAETVGWLAADERHGRDTPSPGLEAAADWLGQRFEAAGLQQLKQGSWFHDYTLPGSSVDSAAIAVKLSRKLGQDLQQFVLEPDKDVRLWRIADVVGGEQEPTTVAVMSDPVLRQMLRARSGRRPIVIEVEEDHPYWRQSQGKRTVLDRQRAAARPVFLVRTGVLPQTAGGVEPGWATDWSVPAPVRVEVPLKNVVALLPGTGKRDEYVVVSAHYDHVGEGDPVEGDSIYNGADDDASGTTAVVMIAAAMSKLPPPRRSVLFVCFSAEEKGLRGSAAFLEHPPVPREAIVANINLEMIGRPEDGGQGKAWITGSNLSDFAEVATVALARRGVEVVDFAMAGMLFSGSDNFSFARHGIVAHSISAGSSISAGRLHRDYHKPSDDVGRLDIAHMTKVIRGLCEFVREVADREAPLRWNELGKKQVERLR